MLLLSTVQHTGTQYMMHKLGAENAILKHCDPDVLVDIDQYERVITTYRNPFLVGGSWVNRYDRKWIEDRWMTQWTAYSEILKHADTIELVAEFDQPVLGSNADTTGAKEAYINGDMDAYYNLIPKYLIDHALEMSQGARYANR